LLLDACKGIYLVGNKGKINYIEIRHRGILANAHITVSSNPYEKMKTFTY
jgi:hypothetical protein